MTRVWGAAARVLVRLAGLGRAVPPGLATTPQLGAMGERAAERLLKSRGFAVLGRNLRVPMGEADILCRDPDRKTIVLVEVKTRLRRAGAPDLSNLVMPEAAVTARKRRKLRAILRHLARANRWDLGCVRIDVVGVEYSAEGGEEPVLRHHIGAVGCR